MYIVSVIACCLFNVLFQYYCLRGTRYYSNVIISEELVSTYPKESFIIILLTISFFYKSKNFQLLTQISTDFMQTGVFHFGKVFFLLFLNFDCIQWHVISSHEISELGSSVSIVSGYGLDDRAIKVWSPAEVKGTFVLPLHPYRLWGPPSLV
jgi:hypothetical protein